MCKEKYSSGSVVFIVIIHLLFSPKNKAKGKEAKIMLKSIRKYRRLVDISIISLRCQRHYL